MNIPIIFLAIFCALGGYVIGLHRGWKTYEHPCPQEDLDAYFNAGYEAGARAALKSKNGERFLEALDELFREENEGDDDDENKNVIDCGEY